PGRSANAPSSPCSWTARRRCPRSTTIVGDPEVAGVGAGRRPYCGRRRAAAGTCIAPRLLAVGDRIAGPARRGAGRGSATGIAGGNGHRGAAATAAALEPRLYLRDLSAMAAPLRTGDDAQYRACFQLRTAAAGAGDARAGRARRQPLAARAR